MTKTLKIFDYKLSRANGPGNRLIFWVTGCGLGCVGCINAHINPKDAPGDNMTIDQIMVIIKEAQNQGIEGLSFSGGEVLSQKKPFTKLLKRIKEETDLTVLIYTGLTHKEITGMRDTEFLAYSDVLLCGRFDPSKFKHGSPLAHKEIWTLTKAYSKRDINNAFRVGAEIEIDLENGDLEITGVNSMLLLGDV